MVTVAGFMLTGTSLTVSKIILFSLLGLWSIFAIALKIKGDK